MITSKPDTILMTADTIGGVWTYAMDICRVLQKHNVDVHIATMGSPLSKDQNTEAAELSNVEIHESDFSLEWMENPWKDVEEAGEWLLQLEHQVQPDVIHLNNYVHGNLPWQAPVLAVGHSCVLSWWEAVNGQQAPEKWNTYREKVRQGLQQVDCVVAVSHHMMKNLQKFYGPFTATEIIYNTRNAEQYHPNEKEQIIFSMGRFWDEAKNIASIAQIAKKLYWPVNAAGDFGGASIAEAEDITLLGKISQAAAAEWLSKASIYVMPAKYEPFGLSILEAALSECALVVGDIPSLKEIWGDAASYADPDNPEELQYRINELIENPIKLKAKAKEARNHARRYSVDLFELNYLNLYCKMIFLEKKHLQQRNQSEPIKMST